MRVLVACEFSGTVRDAFRARGHDAWSCDLRPDINGSPYHIQGDALEAVARGWDQLIAHPPCTYLTNSAAWAFPDPDFERHPGVGYHQRVKPGTLTGAARRAAQDEAAAFFIALYNSPVERVAIENPGSGAMSKRLRPADQIIHPHQFGSDASKGTGLWLRGLPKLKPTCRVRGRMVEWPPLSGKMVERWANQTDSGQNRLTPSEDREAIRSVTYPGIADAMAEQWGEEHPAFTLEP